MIHFLPYWEDKPLNVDAAIATLNPQLTNSKPCFPANPFPSAKPVGLARTLAQGRRPFPRQ